MNVLHHDLEAIETTRFGSLYLIRETLDEVLVDDTIGSGKESEDM